MLCVCDQPPGLLIRTLCDSDPPQPGVACCTVPATSHADHRCFFGCWNCCVATTSLGRCMATSRSGLAAVQRVSPTGGNYYNKRDRVLTRKPSCLSHLRGCCCRLAVRCCRWRLRSLPERRLYRVTLDGVLPPALWQLWIGLPEPGPSDCGQPAARGAFLSPLHACHCRMRSRMPGGVAGCAHGPFRDGSHDLESDNRPGSPLLKTHAADGAAELRECFISVPPLLALRMHSLSETAQTLSSPLKLHLHFPTFGVETPANLMPLLHLRLIKGTGWWLP